MTRTKTKLKLSRTLNYRTFTNKLVASTGENEDQRVRSTTEVAVGGREPSKETAKLSQKTKEAIAKRRNMKVSGMV